MKLHLLCLTAPLLLAGLATSPDAQGGPTPERVAAQARRAAQDADSGSAAQRRLRPIKNGGKKDDGPRWKKPGFKGTKHKGAGQAQDGTDLPVKKSGGRGGAAGKKGVTKPISKDAQRRQRIKNHLDKGGELPKAGDKKRDRKELTPRERRKLRMEFADKKK